MAFIQSTTAKDWPKIKDIIQKSFTVFGSDEPKQVIGLIKALMNHPDAHRAISLMATVQGQICGYILLFPTEHEKQLYYILAPIGVLPAFQQKAVGSHLIQTALMKLPDQAAGTLVLGDKYYERFGFKPCMDFNLRQPFEGSEQNQYFLSRPAFIQPASLTTLNYPEPFFINL